MVGGRQQNGSRVTFLNRKQYTRVYQKSVINTGQYFIRKEYNPLVSYFKF